MKINKILLIISAVILCSACASQKKKDQTISLSGAFALYPLVVKWTEEYQKLNPEVRFNISGGGAGKGMADALAGAVDLGMFSRDISDEEKAKNVWWVGLTIDAVVPTISDQNPYLDRIRQNGMSRESFAQIFIEGQPVTWGFMLDVAGSENDIVSVLTRSDACDAAETWAKYLGGKQEDLKGIGIFGDPGLAEAVTKDKLSIGYNNTAYAYDIKTGKKRPGLEVVPIDINGNGLVDADEDFYSNFTTVLQAIATGVYPSPPARELYFVANGKPTKKTTLNFIEWCLTEGQQYVAEAGYVPLDKTKIEEYRKKVSE